MEVVDRFRTKEMGRKNMRGMGVGTANGGLELAFESMRFGFRRLLFGRSLRSILE